MTDEITQADRELLAAEYERDGFDWALVREAYGSAFVRQEDCALRAIAAARRQGQVPDGWVLVPKEPTRGMVDAGIMFGTSPNKAAMIFQNMVHAAPEPSAEAREQCPSCDGDGWSIESVDSFACVTCPDCAGSGRAERSISVNEAHAPPSAPVGVEGLAEKWRAIAEGDRRDGDEFTANRVEACAEELEASLAQQPAAVDGADKAEDAHAVWANTEQGRMLGLNGPVHGESLRERIRLAFCAGHSAAIAAMQETRHG